MLHDAVISRQAEASGHTDRRRGFRVPFPAELTLIWHHAPGTLLRYRIIDAGDGGFRICTAHPPAEGTTGMALRLLPEGQVIDRPVMVAWVGAAEEGGEAPVGLRYF